MTGGPEITSVKWLGLLCRIELTGAGSGVLADLRALPADPKTSIAEEAKETFSAGKVSLIVPDEEHEGERAHLVLVGPDGQILVAARGDRGEEPMSNLDAARQTRRRGVRRLPRSQGPRPTVPRPVPGADLRRRVHARPLLRHHRSRRDRRRARRWSSGRCRTAPSAPARRSCSSHRAREKGRVKIIDLLRARLDSKSDAYKAELPSLQLNDIHISDELVNEHDRMLTGGFYAEVTLEYIAALGKESGRSAVPRRADPTDPDVDP